MLPGKSSVSRQGRAARYVRYRLGPFPASDKSPEGDPGEGHQGHERAGPADDGPIADKESLVIAQPYVRHQITSLTSIGFRNYVNEAVDKCGYESVGDPGSI